MRSRREPRRDIKGGTGISGIGVDLSQLDSRASDDDDELEGARAQARLTAWLESSSDNAAAKQMNFIDIIIIIIGPPPPSPLCFSSRGKKGERDEFELWITH